VTTRGRLTIAVAVAAAVLGGLTGWREWTAIAAALAVVLVAAVLMALGRSSAAVELDLPRSRFVVGEPGVALVQVRNTSTRRMWPLRMELEVGGESLTVPVPALRAGGTHLVSIALPTDHRAVVEIGPLRAVRGDVFGLIRRVVQWPVRRQVFVHPRTVRPTSALPGFVRDLDGEESTKRTASDLSFHTLREYVPGDDRRFIHWKSTARSGTLQVREFLQTHRSLVAVVLSGSRADYHWAMADRAAPDSGLERRADDEFEVAVSCAASIVAELVRQRREVVTSAAGTRIVGITADRVLDQFSAVDAAPEAPDLIFQTTGLVGGAGVRVGRDVRAGAGGRPDLPPGRERAGGAGQDRFVTAPGPADRVRRLQRADRGRRRRVAQCAAGRRMSERLSESLSPIGGWTPRSER
jgi:uncharacterized protein (DUF58 family)